MRLFLFQHQLTFALCNLSFIPVFLSTACGPALPSLLSHRIFPKSSYPQRAPVSYAIIDPIQYPIHHKYLEDRSYERYTAYYQPIKGSWLCEA
jgi:hypothetical protein